MANLVGIRAAIALKSAVTGIEVSTSSNFGGVADSPMVLVNASSGFNTIERGMGFERVEYDFPADLLIAKPGDIEDAVELAEALLERLRVAAQSGVTLGYGGTVEDSWIASAEAGELEYAGQKWIGAKIHWKVQVWEPTTRSA